MASLSQLTTITTSATALNNLILVSPQKTVGYQPQTSFAQTTKLQQSLPAILFHYEGEQSVMIESDITDHYIENNTALQDMISRKPETVTTHGYIGELNDVLPIGNTILQTLQSKLLTISAYTPQLTITALNAYNQAFQAYQIAANAFNSAVSTWATLSNTGGESVVGNTPFAPLGNQNKQQTAFQQFYGYWANRTLFTVQTPWAVFQNMAIQSLRAVQDAETNVLTDFEVKFKRIRLAVTASVTNQQAQELQERARIQDQASSPTSLGTSTILQNPNTSLGDLLPVGVG